MRCVSDRQRIASGPSTEMQDKSLSRQIWLGGSTCGLNFVVIVDIEIQPVPVPRQK